MMMASYEKRNALQPVMHEHDNQRELLAEKRKTLSRYAIKQNLLVKSLVAAKLEPAKRLYNTQVVPDD
jgi:hypothetical protein